MFKLKPKYLSSLTTLTLLAACASEGQIGSGIPPIGGPGIDPATGEPISTAIPATTAGGPDLVAPGPVECTGSLLPARIWRLNDDQLMHAVQDLLPGIQVPEVSTAGRDAHEFISVEGRYHLDDVFVNQLQGVAEKVAADAMTKVAELSGCATSDADCIQAFSLAFADRAFRRPLSEAENTGLTGLFAAGDNPADGFARVIEAVLQSPSFLYRSELGATASADGVVRLTDHEMATALGFFFLDSTPDAELRAAAEAGTLNTNEQVRAQVERLMIQEEVQSHLTELFMTWLEFPNVMGIEKNGVPDQIGFDQAVRESILAEAQSFIHNVLWSGGGVQQLYSSRDTWATGAAAQILGVDGSDASIKKELDPTTRAGLLTRPALASAVSSGINQVVHRGRIMRELVLCGTVPPPPVDLNVEEINKDLEGASELERMASRAAIPQCLGCHSFMDPLGISFEGYGPVGNLVESPDDSSGSLTGTDVDGPFNNIVDLSELLAASETSRTCVTQQMLGYAVGKILTTADSCMTTAVSQNLPSPDAPLKNLFVGIVLSDAFTYRTQGVSQ